MISSFKLLGLLAFASATHSCVAQTSAPAPVATPSRGTLIQNDFENAGWADLQPTAVGTIDVAGSTQASGALAGATISSGPLPTSNSATNLGKLTLAFNLSASAAKPVTVRVESFDPNKKRSGGLETTIYPDAPDFYQRYALELSNFVPNGDGKFAPDAPFSAFSFSFAADETNWQGIETPEIRLDNVNFAKPAYYVSEKGNDQNDGRTEQTAFATPQQALDVAGAGDIIVVMDGTYKPRGQQQGVAFFRRPGTAAGWITLKNYPGQTPTFALSNAWAAVRIGRPKGSIPANDNSPALAYLEVRGLHVRGEGDVAKDKYADALGKASPLTNGNGLMADGRDEPNKPHHLRFADNVIEFCPGGGIAPNETDWVFIENNVVRNNSWTTIYGTSGISVNGGANFDGSTGGYRVLVAGNQAFGNRTFVPWSAVKKISDGNGIIIDLNQNNKLPENERFSGRTLVCNNLTVGNGGSGIHAFKSKAVDIINNTAYGNGASPELKWGRIFVQQSDDVRIINNLGVAPAGQPINSVGPSVGDQNSMNIVRAHNIWFGGDGNPTLGEGDVIADPMFVLATTDWSKANFQLAPNSPALGAGKATVVTPSLRLGEQPRGDKSSVGAYQK